MSPESANIILKGESISTKYIFTILPIQVAPIGNWNSKPHSSGDENNSQTGDIIGNPVIVLSVYFIPAGETQLYRDQ